MALHKVTGRNSYCGPAALSAVFGIPSHDTASHLRAVTGKASVRGVHDHHMRKTLRDAQVSITSREWPVKIAPTFSQWLRGRVHGIYILTISNHYVAVDVYGKTFADSGAWEAKKPRPLKEFPHPKARVRHAIRINYGSMPRVPKPPSKPRPTTFAQLLENYGSEGLKAAVASRREDLVEGLAYDHGDASDSPEQLLTSYYGFDDISQLDRCLFDDVCEHEQEDRTASTIRMLAGRYKLGGEIGL